MLFQLRYYDSEGLINLQYVCEIDTKNILNKKLICRQVTRCVLPSLCLLNRWYSSCPET